MLMEMALPTEIWLEDGVDGVQVDRGYEIGAIKGCDLGRLVGMASGCLHI